MTARQVLIGIGLLAAASGLVGCASSTRGSVTSPTGTTPATTSAVPPTSRVPSTSGETISSTPAVSSPPASASTPPSSRPLAAQPAPAVHKVPPDATAPAAGSCSRVGGSQVLVLINPDVPAPRCVIVAAGQHLAVRNNTGELGQPARKVTLRWADYPPRTLAPGSLTSYPHRFDSYLMPGVHRLQASVYGQSGAEIWLRP
jgi:hypothetical protein